MKHIALAILLVISASLPAQERIEDDQMKTLFSGKPGVGGYLALSSKFTRINDEDALLTGGGLNIVAGRSVNIGFEGYGLVSSTFSNRLDTAGNNYYMYMGYGGLNIEPVIGSNEVIHVTIPVLLGVGGVGYSTRHFWYEEPNGDINIDFDHDVRSGRAFLIAEPGANIELNVFKWMRIAAGASYRFTEQFDTDNLPKEDLDGLSLNLAMRFGWF